MDKEVGRETQELDRVQRLADRWFLQIEYGVYAAIGLLLVFTALFALASAAYALFQGAREWQGGGIFEAIDQLLFVLMLVEILHTVRMSLRSGALSVEPFLIVGLIASIRRVLVITLETAHDMHGEASGDLFRYAMIELGVLAALILVMVTSMYVLRRAGGSEV